MASIEYAISNSRYIRGYNRKYQQNSGVSEKSTFFSVDDGHFCPINTINKGKHDFVGGTIKVCRHCGMKAKLAKEEQTTIRCS